MARKVKVDFCRPLLTQMHVAIDRKLSSLEIGVSAQLNVLPVSDCIQPIISSQLIIESEIAKMQVSVHIRTGFRSGNICCKVKRTSHFHARALRRHQAGEIKICPCNRNLKNLGGKVVGAVTGYPRLTTHDLQVVEPRLFSMHRDAGGGRIEGVALDRSVFPSDPSLPLRI